MEIDPASPSETAATMPVLLTPYVFVDTSAFWRGNFNWRSPPFGALQRLCAAGTLRLLTSDIVRREIDANLLEKLKLAADAVAKARKAGSILSQADPDRTRLLFAPVDLAAAHATLRDKAAGYFDACQALALDVYGVSSRAIFDAYFAGAAPFGEGDKKAEFPDAYNLAALRDWAVAEGERVYVVSGDRDLRNACADDPALIWVDRLEAVIAAAQAEADLTAEVQTAIARAHPLLRAIVGAEFPRLRFVLEAQRGDISSVNVVKADFHEVILVDREEAWRQLDVRVRVTFRALAEFDDMVTAAWDNDAKAKVPWRRVQDEVLEMSDVVLDVQLHQRGPNAFEVVRAVIREPETVYVTLGPGGGGDV